MQSAAFPPGGVLERVLLWARDEIVKDRVCGSAPGLTPAKMLGDLLVRDSRTVSN
ncbi:hypothetical protein [Rhodothalassium salexigens]|uniref:hypothetical protein n=1 Tax=Rhodothalassium salexigens TaxID=1086 RepID=UPI001914A624|nr:hypothetical protein [Rhodothalassium salexigens]